jgi:hypothetical protein
VQKPRSLTRPGSAETVRQSERRTIRLFDVNVRGLCFFSAEKEKTANRLCEELFASLFSLHPARCSHTWIKVAFPLPYSSGASVPPVTPKRVLFLCRGYPGSLKNGRVVCAPARLCGLCRRAPRKAPGVCYRLVHQQDARDSAPRTSRKMVG